MTDTVAGHIDAADVFQGSTEQGCAVDAGPFGILYIIKPNPYLGTY